MNRLYKLILGTCILMATQYVAAQPAQMVTFKVNTAPKVMLETDMYFSDTSAPAPVILLRTPYPRRQYTNIAHYFTSQGYIMLVQSVRGTGGSTGQMVPFIYETSDGLATLDYLEQQSWSNGKVGMFGASYAGFAGITLGNTGHRALQAIVNLSGWDVPNKIAYPSGVNHLMMNIPWMLFNFSQGKLIPGRYHADSLLNTLPVNQMLAMTGAPATFSQMQAPIKAFNHNFSYSNFHVPIMHVTGMYDFTREGTLTLYDSLRQYQKQQYLVFGPWMHDQLFSGSGKAGDYTLPANQVNHGREILKKALSWFNRYLKKEASQATEPGTYQLFPVWGDSTGLSFPAYPEKAIKTKSWFLQVTATSAQNGKLVSPKETTTRGQNFTSDPHTPVPTYGGANFHFFPDRTGMKDQSEIEKRKDVLVFTSETLSADMLVLGKATVRLFGSWEGKDCDFTAKLVAVDTENRAWIMSDAIARMSIVSKTATTQKDEAGNMIYGFDLDLGHQNFLLKKGWKIRVEIAGSNFPKYERNAGTGENSTLATALQPVKQAIWTGKVFPSAVTIEILQR